MTADVESYMLRRVSTAFREYTSVTYVVARRSMNKCPEALHALKLALTWVRYCGRWLIRVNVRTIRGRARARARVRLLRNDALVLIVLDDVAWLVPEALSFGKRVDERFCLDRQQTLFEAFVKKGVAGSGDDKVGDLV